MKVAIRTDASIRIGSGHVMRCLTLAEQLIQSGAEIAFICRLLEGHLVPHIESKGMDVFGLPAPIRLDGPMTLEPENCDWLEVPWELDAAETCAVLSSQDTCVDWIVVDHYSLGAAWERIVRPHTAKVMVIDDLANRRHECDLLLDQNLSLNPDNRYAGLIPQNCKVFVGPQFALLRDEFIHAKQSMSRRHGEVRRVLVFFGGSDPSGETQKALGAIAGLNRPDVCFDVIVGNMNESRDDIVRRCEMLPNVQCLCEVANVAELMAKADLALGAGGIAAWERCFMGLPAITVQIAQNQVEVLTSLASHGAVWYLGPHQQVSSDSYREYLLKALSSRSELIEMSLKASSLMGPEADIGSRLITASMMEISSVCN